MYRSLTKHPPFTRKCESNLNTVELVDKLWTRMMLVDVYAFVYACRLCVCVYVCVYVCICVCIHVRAYMRAFVSTCVDV